MKKKNIFILAIILVILISAILGGWYLLEEQRRMSRDYNNKINELESQVQNLKTEINKGTEVFANINSKDGWKNYKNTALGFEVETPITATISFYLNEDPNHLVDFKLDDKNSFEVRLGEAEGRDGSITKLDDFYYLDFPRDTFETINDYKFAVFKASGGYCDGPGCGMPFIAYVMQKDKTFYEIVFYGDAELSVTERDILETFKLL